MGTDLTKHQNFGHIFYWFCKHWAKIFGKNLTKYSVHCFVLTICITSCNTTEVKDKTIDTTITTAVDGDTQRIRLSKLPKLLFRRDVNQNIDSIQCNTDEECNQITINTICRQHLCLCSNGYKRLADNNTCIPITTDNIITGEHNQSKNTLNTENKNQEKPKEKYNGSHMLPIMIVLGIMFIGMCVALNLFSRARFRQSRGIFSKPHLIKFNNNGSTKSSNYKSRRTSPPNPNNNSVTATSGAGVQGITVAESELTKNGSYVSIALES